MEIMFQSPFSEPVRSRLPGCGLAVQVESRAGSHFESRAGSVAARGWVWIRSAVHQTPRGLAAAPVPVPVPVPVLQLQDAAAPALPDSFAAVHQGQPAGSMKQPATRARPADTPQSGAASSTKEAGPSTNRGACLAAC